MDNKSKAQWAPHKPKQVKRQSLCQKGKLGKRRFEVRVIEKPSTQKRYDANRKFDCEPTLVGDTSLKRESSANSPKSKPVYGGIIRTPATGFKQ